MTFSKSFLALFALTISTTSALAATDPFLWLEDVDAARSLDWVNAHNSGTTSKLQSRAVYPQLEKEFFDIVTSKARLPGISLSEGKIYNFWQDTKNPRGKLRLLYEAAPMAFIAEQAGGSATDGVHRILDIVPQDLHQRTPLVIGSREDVGYVADTLRRMGEG